MSFCLGTWAISLEHSNKDLAQRGTHDNDFGINLDSPFLSNIEQPV